MFGDVKLVELA